MIKKVNKRQLEKLKLEQKQTIFGEQEPPKDLTVGWLADWLVSRGLKVTLAHSDPGHYRVQVSNMDKGMAKTIYPGTASLVDALWAAVVWVADQEQKNSKAFIEQGV